MLIAIAVVGWTGFLGVLVWVLRAKAMIWDRRIKSFCYFMMVLSDEETRSQAYDRFAGWIKTTTATDETMVYESVVAVEDVADRLYIGDGTEGSLEFAIRIILDARESRTTGVSETSVPLRRKPRRPKS